MYHLGRSSKSFDTEMHGRIYEDEDAWSVQDENGEIYIDDLDEQTAEAFVDLSNKMLLRDCEDIS